MAAISRRNLLGLSALAMASTAVRAFDGQGADPPVYISAASDSNDQHWVHGFTHDTHCVVPLFKVALPARGHHVAIHPAGGFFVAVARRPGTWLVLADARTGEQLQTITLPVDRHLFGHGVFTADGQQFITTESDFNDLTGDSGRIVVWEVQQLDGRPALSRRAEFPSYGVGPHELLLMPDQHTLAVANGGIRTHPEHDRDNLNIETMRPSLAYIDLQNGQLLEQHFLPEQWHQASIRHMDVNAQGLIAMGMQFEGEPWREAPLLATHQPGQALRLLTAPEPVRGQMQQYVGSVRFAADGRSFGASCPRGNLLTFWDTQSGAFIDSVRSRDGCGLCATDSGFVYTSGIGRIAGFTPGAGSVTEYQVPEAFMLQWDNHLSQLA